MSLTALLITLAAGSTVAAVDVIGIVNLRCWGCARAGRAGACLILTIYEIEVFCILMRGYARAINNARDDDDKIKHVRVLYLGGGGNSGTKCDAGLADATYWSMLQAAFRHATGLGADAVTMVRTTAHLTRTTLDGRSSADDADAGDDDGERDGECADDSGGDGDGDESVAMDTQPGVAMVDLPRASKAVPRALRLFTSTPTGIKLARVGKGAFGAAEEVVQKALVGQIDHSGARARMIYCPNCVCLDGSLPCECKSPPCSKHARNSSFLGKSAPSTVP
jgi:hypothetical protein